MCLCVCKCAGVFLLECRRVNVLEIRVHVKCTHTFKCSCLYMSTYIQKHVRNIYMYVCVRVRVRVYIYTHVCTHVHPHIHADASTHPHTHKHTHAHTHTHTHTHAYIRTCICGESEFTHTHIMHTTHTHTCVEKNVSKYRCI